MCILYEIYNMLKFNEKIMFDIIFSKYNININEFL